MEQLGVLLLPIIGAVALLLVALLAAQCRLPRRDRAFLTVMCSPETCTLQLWMMLLLYPSIAKTAILPFDYVKLGDRWRLRADPSVHADDEHYKTLVAMGAVGTLVYSFGFPLVCLFISYRGSPVMHAGVESALERSVRTNNAQQRVKHSGVKTEDARVTRFRRAGLLLRSYHADYWYWECFDVFRKYLLTSVVLAVAPATVLQVYFGLFVSVCATLLLAMTQPYEDQVCGRVQLLALTQLTFTYMTGMIFFDDGGCIKSWGRTTETASYRWGNVLICANVLVFVVLAVGLFRAVGTSLQDTNKMLQEARREQEKLQDDLNQMREMLAKPSPLLMRAKVPMDELEVGEWLGAGCFGEVYAASYHGTPVAVKRMHAHLRTAAGRAQAFRDEVLLLLELRHPNIVMLVGGSWDVESADMCLVLELCEKGSLDALLENALVTLRWVDELLPLAIGMARGMAYLHGQSPPIIHRDLKPANVLLTADLTPKIADMGSAMVLEDGMQDFVAGSGSPLYQAPEVLRREEADQRCDIWSFGCLCCSLSTRSHPFVPIAPDVAVELVAQLKLQPLPPRGSPLALLIEKATDVEFEERPSFEELLKELEDDEMMAFAKDIDAEAMRRSQISFAKPRRSSNEVLGPGGMRERTRDHKKDKSNRGSSDRDSKPRPSRLPRPGKRFKPATTRAADRQSGIEAKRRHSCSCGQSAQCRGGSMHEASAVGGDGGRLSLDEGSLPSIAMRDSAGAGASGGGGAGGGGGGDGGGGGADDAFERMWSEKTEKSFVFAAGARVRHIVRGNGTVVELMGDGRTRVFFDDGGEHRYHPRSMHKLSRSSTAPSAAVQQQIEQILRHIAQLQALQAQQQAQHREHSHSISGGGAAHALDRVSAAARETAATAAADAEQRAAAAAANHAAALAHESFTPPSPELAAAAAPSSGSQDKWALVSHAKSANDAADAFRRAPPRNEAKLAPMGTTDRRERKKGSPYHMHAGGGGASGDDSPPRGVGGKLRKASVLAAEGSMTPEELSEAAVAAAELRERTRARRLSLTSADSSRDLIGHKEGPGRSTKSRGTSGSRSTGGDSTGRRRPTTLLEAVTGAFAGAPAGAPAVATSAAPAAASPSPSKSSPSASTSFKTKSSLAAMASLKEESLQDNDATDAAPAAAAAASIEERLSAGRPEPPPVTMSKKPSIEERLSASQASPSRPSEAKQQTFCV